MIRLKKQISIISIVMIIIIMFPSNLHACSEKRAYGINTTIEDDFKYDANLCSHSGNAFRDIENRFIVFTDRIDSQTGEVWLNEEIRPPLIAEFRCLSRGGTGTGTGCLTLILSGPPMGFTGINGYGIEFGSSQNEWESTTIHISILKNTAICHIKSVNDIRIWDNTWHNVRIIADKNNIEVYVDDKFVLFICGNIDCNLGKIGFQASTGVLDNKYIIDDVKITKINAFIPKQAQAASILRNEEFDVTKRDLTFPYQNIYRERVFEDRIMLYGIAVKIPVLMYHHILMSEDIKTANSLIVTTEEFERQMKYLFENDYTTITTKELESYLNGKLNLPKKSVLITFDDGYQSNYIYAYPILKKYGFKASISLIPKLMPESIQNFKPERMTYLSWQEVLLGSDVFEYTNHTYSHVSMKQISYVKALEEIKQVNDILDSKCFVYPIGHTSSVSEKVLKELNYKIAFTTSGGFVTKASNRLYLRRQRINAGITLKAFLSLLQ